MTPKASFLALSSIYAVGMIWVWAGVLAASSAAYVNLGAIFLLSAIFWFGIAALALWRLRWQLPLPDLATPDWLVLTLLAATVLASLIHYVDLGGVPLLTAMGSSDFIEIAKIRQSINYGSPVFNYLAPLLVKVVYPVLAIALFQRKRTGFALLALILGMAYGATLMQKSFPLYVAIPVAIYLGLSRRFAFSILTVVAAGIIVVAMARVANPPAPPSPVASPITVTHNDIGAGLLHRVLLTPGKAVVEWLAAFPTDYAFEHGCGYRFAAPLLGCRFVNNSELMYRHTAPDYVAMGLNGTRNAAHFAEEYANFGAAGLALAAFLASFILLVVAVLTAGLGAEIAVSINIPFILALTSSALHTTLLSGGWAVAIALSLLLLSQGRQPSTR